MDIFVYLKKNPNFNFLTFFIFRSSTTKRFFFLSLKFQLCLHVPNYQTFVLQKFDIKIRLPCKI